MLKESGNAEERSLADVVEAISDLRVAVTSVDKRMNNPDGLLSPKFFVEFKDMLDNLPSRIENRLELDSKRKRRRFHPMMFEEMMIMEKIEDTSYSFLMMISFIKDDFPWLYEIGLETYRGIKSAKSKADKKKLVEAF